MNVEFLKNILNECSIKYPNNFEVQLKYLAEKMEEIFNNYELNIEEKEKSFKEKLGKHTLIKNE